MVSLLAIGKFILTCVFVNNQATDECVLCFQFLVSLRERLYRREPSLVHMKASSVMYGRMRVQRGLTVFP